MCTSLVAVVIVYEGPCSTNFAPKSESAQSPKVRGPFAGHIKFRGPGHICAKVRVR